MRKRPEYDLKKTGERIRKLRKEGNISVEQIRDFMQFCSCQAIYKWERGMCFPQADNLLALANLFGVNVNEIMMEKKEGGELRIFEIFCRFMKLKRKQNMQQRIYEYTIEVN